MDKTAQSRSIVDRLHEWGNLAGKAQEKLFNPEFERVMDNLRSIDGDIRSIVSGKSIDNGDPGADEVSMKDLLKEARKNFNRREYMTAVAYLGRFHKKANDITNKLDELNVEVNQVHQDFLFKELDPEHKDYLRDLRNRFSNQVFRESLFVEAGIKDLLVNVFSDRGRALAAWERKYPKETKKLKKDTEMVLNKSDDLLKNILASLKKMGSFRAGRKPDPYLREGNRLKSSFEKYHNLFVKYYEENIKGFLDNQDFANPPSETDQKPEQVKREEQPAQEEQRNTIPSGEITPAPQAQREPVIVSRQTEEIATAPTEQKPNISQKPKLQDTVPDTDQQAFQAQTNLEGADSMNDFDEFMKMDEAPDTKLSRSDKVFLKQLVSISSESPILLARNIKRYANTISSKDKNKSYMLNILANKIMER